MGLLIELQGGLNFSSAPSSVFHSEFLAGCGIQFYSSLLMPSFGFCRLRDELFRFFLATMGSVEILLFLQAYQRSIRQSNSVLL